VDIQNPKYHSIDNILYCNDGKELVRYAAGKPNTEFCIPNGVTRICNCAFDLCNKLVRLTIPESVTSIGEYAFSECEQITSFTIPESVNSIGDCALYGCNSLIELFIPFIGHNKNDESTFVHLFKNSNKIPKSLKTVYITTKTIFPDFAFSDCDSIVNIYAPKGLISIGQQAFSECTSLARIVVLDDGVNINSKAFEGCRIKSLTYIDRLYDEAVKAYRIGESQNDRAKYLYALKLFNTILDYGDSRELAEKCNSAIKRIDEAEEAKLESIYNTACFYMSNNRYEDAIKQFSQIEDYRDSKQKIIDCQAGIKLKEAEETERIYQEAIALMNKGKYDKAIDLFFKVIKYKDSMKLKEACQHSKRARKKLIKNIVKYSIIGVVCLALAIYLFTSMKSCMVGEVGTGGSKLELHDDEYWVIGAYPLAQEIEIPSEYKGKPVTKIQEGAFNNNFGIKKVIIPGSVKTIDYLAFNYCKNLSNVTIGDGVTSIGAHAFSLCESLISVDIPNSVTSIGENSFSGCISFTSVIIPNSVISLEDSVFSSCDSLTSVTIPNSVTSIGDRVFNSCDSLTSVTIGNGVTSIGSSAFSNCTSLTSVTIPDSVTSIGARAFSNCTSLKSVTIPDSVTSIGDYAFRDCTGLKSVTIGNDVTSIRDGAFYNCTSLTSIKYRGTQAQWNAITKRSYWNSNTGSYTITYNYTEE